MKLRNEVTIKATGCASSETHGMVSDEWPSSGMRQEEGWGPMS